MDQRAEAAEKTEAVRALARLRVPFVRNDGQTDRSVAFTARTRTGTVFVTQRGGLLYSLHGTPPWVLRETLVGGRSRPAAGTPGTSRVNRHIGDDPRAWRSGIPTCDDIRLGEVWPGIRVQLAARGDSVEKIFTVEPGADAERIRIRLEGAIAIRRGADGSLVAGTGPGDVRLSPPEAWQERGEERVPVAVSYVLEGMEYGFALGAHDPGIPVFIDPILQATYLGGSAEDRGYGVAIEPLSIPPLEGAVYVTGVTQSTDLPAGPEPGVQPASAGGRDVFVACLNRELTELLSTTYLGGSGDDYPGGGGGGSPIMTHIGKVYVTGYTTSSDFPVPSEFPLQRERAGGADAFVARLNSDLWTLERVTHLGGTGDDFGFAIVGDPDIARGGYVYVVGQTTSEDLPGTAGGFQETHGGSAFDAFVARLHYGLESTDPDPLRVTYLGGDNYDKGYGIDLNPETCDVYVVGETMSANLRDRVPHDPDAAQLSLAGGTDAFVARFYPTLFANRNITYFGGASTDQGFAIAVDPESGDVYIAGTTSSESLPGLGAAAQGDLRGVRDAFVARFKDDLTPPVRATYVGGGDSDKGYAMAIAASGDRVYVAGDTTSDDFPGAGVGAQPENAGAGDVFVARIHTDLTWIERSTYLGGSGQDMGLGIAVNSESGDVYVTGLTSSEDFPRTEGGAQPVHGGGPPVFYRDAFVTRLDAGIGVRSIHVSPAALAFPFIAPGERTGLEVEIANRGVRALAVSAFELSDVTNFACRTGAPPACPDPPFALEPGEACTLQVEYAPPAPGEHRAELSVLSDDPSAPRVPLSLEGGAVAGSWIVETVGRGARSVDLVVDESDRVHLCYFVPPSPARGAALRYATHIIPDPFLGALPMPRPEWTFETIADLAEVGTDCSMAVERDGTWHIAYVVEEILYYLRRGSAPILIAEGVLPECSIALDSSEAPFIAYSPYTIYNPLTGAREHPVPHCAYVPLPDPGSMRISLIPGLDMPGRTGGAGPWTDIAFAPPGFEIPWAVFPVDGELILYEIDPGELCFPPDGPAVATAHHAPRVFPQSCQIAIHTSDWSNPFTLAGLDGRDGAATVRKFEMAPEGIRYDHDPLWPEVEYITTGGGAAEPYLHLSLPRHLYHMPNLALYDRYETSLKYVWINASYQSLERCPLDTCAQRVRGQVTERVDEAGDVGAGAQTDMDPSYNPHIAYLDDTNGTVKYARRIHPSGASVAVSPTRWIFGHRDDWRAFFIWARGTGEAVVHDVRIENAVEGRPEDWRVITDCDLEEGEVIGEDLLGGFSSTMRPVCVEIAPGAVPPCRADLVVETSAGTARAELLYGVWPRDGDGDGVWDGEEGPGGDGNGDGVPDDEQDHVASAQALDGWSYLTVTSPHGTELRDVDVISNPSPDDAPPGVAFPFGFLRFRVIDLSPGDAIDVDVHVSGGWTIDAYWMHGPTPDHPAPHWYEFVFDGTTGAEITGSTITLHFVDGLRGDADITANGTIVDPGAPAVVGMVLFRRGDANVDGGADMSDAVAILGHLFLGGPLNDCEDAADVNDDGRMDISDAVRLLLYLFLGSAQPPEPFMTCGGDPTADDLGCNTFSRCP